MTHDPVHPGPDETPEPPSPEGGQDHDITWQPEQDKHPDEGPAPVANTDPE